MYNNIKMRLTPWTVVATSTVLVVGLTLLLGASPAAGFRLSKEGGGDPEARSKANNIPNSNLNNNNNNEIASSSKNNGLAVPQTSLSLSESSGATSAAAASSSSSARSISKRSLSSSSSSVSSGSSDPSSFRSHRHENSILNVAWPPNAMWGFLPSKKKSPVAPLSLHSQSSSSTSSYNKKASLSSPSDSSALKKKSASSDLFLDPVTLDEEESPSSYFSSRHIAGTGEGAASSQNFFHSAAGSSHNSKGGSSSNGGHPTPPPRLHYILLQPPTRIEPPLGNDIGAAEEDEELMENEIFGESPPARDLHGEDHANWLKRSSSSNSGIVTRSSSEPNKRTIKYDIPQIVLRLVRPALIGPLSLTCDSRDLAGDLWEKELNTDVTTVPGLENLSLGQFLRLPQGFGNIYLGETFSSYVCIQNESPVSVTNAVVKIELQTQTQKFILADNRSLPVMKTGDTIDIVMHHEVKEMGKHMLICTITYTVPNPGAPPTEPITIERFFKFQVKKPLDVKTKLYNSESDEVFLEAQVQNITASSMCLEKVDLEPSAAFSCVAMNKLNEAELLIRKRIGVPVSAVPRADIPGVMLDTDCSYQFLYRLTPKTEQARLSTNIGKLDIVWRSCMGERGRLQTSQLQRQPPVLNELRLVVEKVPDSSSVDLPFEACCKLSNLTQDREMDLQLELDPTTDGYCWVGVTKTKIGSLGPNQKFNLNLIIFPIRTGIINISGIKITDIKKGEKFTFNDVVQVFVMQNMQ